MKTKLERPLIVLFISCLLFFEGCGKHTGSTSQKKSNTDYITSGPWYVKNYQEDDSIDGSIDYSTGPVSCRKDDTYSFANNNILTFDPGTVTCDTADTKSAKTWAFAEDETVLSFSGYSYNIKSLNDTLLSLYYDTTYSGSKLRIYYNFKH